MDTARSISSARFLGFFTVLLLFTLDGDSGRDLCDVLVEYVEAKTAEVRNASQG